MCNLPQDDKKQIKFSLVKHNHDDRVVLMPTARNVLRPELELDARLEDDVESDFGFQMPGHPSGKSVSAAELSLLFSPLDPVTRRNMAAMKARWTAPAQAPAAGAPAQHSPAGAPARASHASVSHAAHTAHAPAPHAGSRSHDSGSAEPMQVDQAERTPLSALCGRPTSSVSHAGRVQAPHTVRRDCATRSARPPQTPPGRPSAQQAASAGLTELVQRPKPTLMMRLWASMWTDPPEAIEAELKMHPEPRILAYRWLTSACQPLQFTPLRVSPTIPAATQPPDNVSAESTQPPTELSAEPMALIPATAQPPVNSSVESTASISAAAQPALQTVQEFLQLYDRRIPIKLNSPGIDSSEHLPARQVLKPFVDKGSEWMSAEALDFCFGRLQQANITSQNGVKVTFWHWFLVVLHRKTFTIRIFEGLKKPALDLVEIVKSFLPDSTEWSFVPEPGSIYGHQGPGQTEEPPWTCGWLALWMAERIARLGVSAEDLQATSNPWPWVPTDPPPPNVGQPSRSQAVPPLSLLIAEHVRFKWLADAARCWTPPASKA
ncbi:hypothetical protein CAOG_09161 [Capsaspora owczarzaki ATCC 30864]|uniref:hypothetical protein n=1 Tax=Capsaspora owczarzaki (strain ATCC 30864) TaxID=595528 RepID=UPI0003522D9E|nr:hypothetical protein CAOG_09161 [Capsaspora owczarzaki ATCC 30864]|eukprot:XP_011270874.1 hypothetical protein CAOG_09161 [Capsaspora owczarzaki ATCC 30864]